MNDPFFSYYGMAGVSGGGIVGCGGGGTGLVEVNSSGDIVFNKTINETMFDVATDPAGNIYVTGPGAANVTPILKFNSTGTLLWKKTIGMSGLNGRGITTDGVHVYVCGTSTGGSFLLKVDANGPCDGTYGACTIAPGTSIVGTGSPTNSAYTAASSVGSRTEQALTLTNNTPAYTRTIQSI